VNPTVVGVSPMRELFGLSQSNAQIFITSCRELLTLFSGCSEASPRRCIASSGDFGDYMRYILPLLACGLAVSSCAKRPDAIVPVYVPMAAYSNLDCPALAREYLNEQSSLTAISKQQHDAATGDAVGVFLVGVPMSSTFGGDKEGQVAVAKGKVHAVEANMKAKGCNTPTVAKAAGAKGASR